MGQAQDLPDVGYSPDLIEILFPRRIYADLPLSDQKYILIRLHGPLQGGDGYAALHIKCQIHMGKNRQAPKGQDGNIHGNWFHGVLLSSEEGKSGRGARRPFLLAFKTPTSGRSRRSSAALPCRCSISQNS